MATSFFVFLESMSTHLNALTLIVEAGLFRGVKTEKLYKLQGGV